MKKELNLDKLSTSQKLKVKKPEASLDTEKAVQAIHSQPAEKEKVKRVTIDVPHSLYMEIKQHILFEEKALKDYF